jgi:uncharacterized protein (TIGR00369 family)
MKEGDAVLTTKNSPDERSRRVTWEDPTSDLWVDSTMSGLEYLSAVKEGRIPPPPVWNLVNFRLTEAAAGRVLFEIAPAQYHYNRFGKVQGGIACTILDSAMACTVTSVLPEGTGFTTLDLKVQYFRPMSVETGLMRCVGAIIHRGDRIVVAEARMLDNGDLLYAYAMSSCMIFSTTQKKGSKGL